MVEGLIKNVTCEEITIAIKAVKQGKAAGLSEVCAEMICASEKIGIYVIMKLCKRFWDEKGILS